MSSTTATLEEAVALVRAGDLGAAEAICRARLVADPREASAAQILIKILGTRGEHVEAASWAERAIGAHPDQAGFQFSLGFNRQALGDSNGAVAAYLRAIELQTDHVEARTNLGLLLHDRGDSHDAVPHLEEALRVRPNHVAAWNNLGRARLALGDAAAAVACHTRALEIQPDHANAHNLLACALRAQERTGDAEVHWRRAVELNPRLADAHSNLASLLLEQDRYRDSEAHLARALTADPNHVGALLNRANLCELERRLEEAIALGRRAIELDPANALAHANLGIHLLTFGDFERGWSEREWRLEKAEFRAAARDFGKPRWTGAADPNLRLLVHAEQGLGDSIQFVRYLRLARERVGHTILECPARLDALFRSVAGVDEIVVRGGPLPAFDAHIPMLSLPHALETRIESIPAVVPYLHADPQRLERCAAGIANDGRFRIGLAWAGSPANGTDRRRSMPLAALRPLFDVSGTRFYSLQKGPGSEAGAEIPELIDLAPGLENFADDAAAMQHLDLVISVDTSVAHLAGALGRPVWTLLCFAADWRWMTNRDDTPWYPSMRLFRQPEAGAWGPVVARVKEELRATVAARSVGRRARARTSTSNGAR